jgi:23S rRNA pseudouridine1911/1915/1917 synthase
MKPSVNVVFEDNHLLVLDKPGGLLTQPDEGGGESAESFGMEWIRKKYKKPGRVFLHVIHRLDRAVSGLLLFARTSKALSRLGERSREGKIERIYWAELEGDVVAGGVLEHRLLHGDRRAIISEGGKLARLHFHVLHRKEGTTVVEVKLETGRYHQIRAQFGAIGHPIVGDRKYGAKREEAAIHLTCVKLSLFHPVTGAPLVFQAAPRFALH